MKDPGGPRLVDESQSPRVVYDRPSENVVGSALASVSGPSDQTEYHTHRVFLTQRPAEVYLYGVNQEWQVKVDSHS